VRAVRLRLGEGGISEPDVVAMFATALAAGAGAEHSEHIQRSDHSDATERLMEQSVAGRRWPRYGAEIGHGG